MAEFGRGVWIGISIGVAVTLLGSYVVKGSFWRYQGQSDGRREVFSALKKEFGTVEAGVPYEALIDRKCDSVVVMRVNGVRAVRITP